MNKAVLRRGKKLWADEWCDRVAGGESVYEAWERLFGEPLDTSRAIQVDDRGDAVMHHMPNGHAVTFACDGNYIHQSEPVP
jgi:hypothetical protein